MKKKLRAIIDIFGATLGLLICVLMAAGIITLLLTGCGHNAIVYGDGIGLEVGFVPDQYQVAVTFRYGKILSAAVKEKAEVSLETDTGNVGSLETSAVQTDTKVKTKLLLKTGDQVTGYVVDLAEVEAAKGGQK